MASRKGRPLGAVEDPKALLRRDLKDQVLLNKRMRQVLLKQLAQVEEALENLPEGDISTRLGLIQALSESLTAQAGGMEKTAKHVLAANEREEETEVDIQKILGRQEEE